MSGRAPRVVAELGRPETPEETEERKARDRRLRRARQNVRNLVYSLLVCVAIVAVIVLAVPRGGAPAAPPVGYRSLAAQSAASAGEPLLAPPVPATWRANAAELRSKDGVTSWYTGFVLPQNRFVSYSQGLRANDSWLTDLLDSARPGGTTRIGGLTWRVYDQRSLGSDAGDVAYALATRIGTTYLVVSGTATVGQTDALAAALAADAQRRALPGKDTAP